MVKLLKWQQEAKERLENLAPNNGLCLWCDTGLGKGILGAELAKEANNTLIVCPPHLISDWKDKLSLVHVNELTKDNLVINKGINIISYNKLVIYGDDLVYNTDAMLVILDEAHKAKNHKSKTYKHLRLGVLDYAYKTLLLSATFMTKSNVDLYAPSTLTSERLRKTYSSFWSFSKANVEFKQIFLFKRIIEQPIKIREKAVLEYIQPNFMLVTYESAGIPRPEYNVIKVPVESNQSLAKRVNAIKKQDLDSLVDNLDTITAVERDYIVKMLSNPHSKFAQISNNIEYVLDGKTQTYNYKHKIELVKSIIDTEGEGKKGLLFYYYQGELEHLKKNFPKAFYLDTKKDITKQINDFETGDYELFIANYAALGEGVRFKRSHYIVEFTLIYDYAKIIQARGRLQYTGRKDTYKVYHLELQHDVVSNLVKNIHTKERSVEENRKLLGYT